MKSFVAGIVAGGLVTAVLLGAFASNFAVAQPADGAGVKFVGITNATDKSNTRAIAENGDIYVAETSWGRRVHRFRLAG